MPLDSSSRACVWISSDSSRRCWDRHVPEGRFAFAGRIAEPSRPLAAVDVRVRRNTPAPSSATSTLSHSLPTKRFAKRSWGHITRRYRQASHRLCESTYSKWVLFTSLSTTNGPTRRSSDMGSPSPLPSFRPQCLRRLHPQRAEGGHNAGEGADTDHQNRVPDQQRGIAERQHADPGPLELR